MEQHSLQKAVNSGVKKIKMLENEQKNYWLRAILAGIYLSLIVFLYWSLKHKLHESPFGEVVASLFFGVGLVVIVFTNSELFTSNNMYLAVSSLSRQTGWKQTAKLWTYCYLGNWIGAIVMTLLLLGAGVLAPKVLPADHLLFKGAAAKVSLDWYEIFFRGILANWVVCLAVWVSFQLKEEMAKITAIILVVSVFVYLGFEHSIANLGTFSMAIVGQYLASLDPHALAAAAPHAVTAVQGALADAHAAAPAVPHITSAQALYNLLFSTIGNIVGGGVIVGFNYWFLNREELAAEEEAKA